MGDTPVGLIGPGGEEAVMNTSSNLLEHSTNGLAKSLLVAAFIHKSSCTHENNGSARESELVDGAWVPSVSVQLNDQETRYQLTISICQVDKRAQRKFRLDVLHVTQ